MRLIDGDVLKRKAQKVATEAWKMRIKSSVETILNQFIDWIDNAPTIEERKWTPCSERPPENEEDFLVTDGESMAVGYYRQDAKAWDNADFGWIENREKGYGINEVIAWMPLPEPYVERRTDESDR